MAEIPYLISLPDAQTLAEQLADDIAERLSAAVAERGRASLVVPGGSTPVALFDVLSRRRIAWDRVAVIPGDERWVDADDPASNEGLIRSHLLKRRAAAAMLVGLKTPHARPHQALAEVGARLQAVARPFDVMVLGLGEDGHTASLFPGSVALEASLKGDQAQVQAVEATGAAGAAWRVTLALPALLDSRFIALLFTGERKLAVLREAQAGDDALKLPIRAILNGARSAVHVYWSA